MKRFVGMLIIASVPTCIRAQEAGRSVFRDWLSVEVAVSGMRPAIGASKIRATYLIPEIRLQVQKSEGAVIPYVDVGTGMVVRRGGPVPSSTSLATTAGLGVHFDVGAGFGSRIEARVRGIGSGFQSSMVQITAGISRRF